MQNFRNILLRVEQHTVVCTTSSTLQAAVFERTISAHLTNERLLKRGLIASFAARPLNLTVVVGKGVRMGEEAPVVSVGCMMSISALFGWNQYCRQS